MQTSNTARLIVAAIIFASFWIIVYANLRLLAFTLTGRKTHRFEKLTWPTLLAGVVLCIVDATKIEPNWYQVTHHTIETNKLRPGSRIRIVHLTDFHLNPQRPDELETRLIKLTRRERPDLIALTGDYTVYESRDTLRRLKRITADLVKTAPVYAVDGNWDSDKVMKALAEEGANILSGWVAAGKSDTAQIALVCIPWYKPRLSQVPDQMRNMFKLALCHMPEHFEITARHGIDLTLAGHTHGGQVRIPIFGALLPDQQLVGRYQAGMYSKGSSRLYVNRGIGMEGGAAPQVRFFCRPEIAVFDIVGRR
ncbi:MAG: metallophosphoesterase [Armatimonadota bacterium]